MSFSEELPKKTWDETKRRATTEYVKFVPEYRVTLRMIDTNARTVWKHWISQANKGRGLSANCPNVRADMSVCPLEASVRSLPKDSPERRDKVARRRFVVNVLDRTPYTTCLSCNTPTPQTRAKECINCHADTSKQDFAPLNKVKIVEGGVKLFNQSLNPIQQMQQEDYDGADITMYDIVFTTMGEGRDKQISAVPQAPKELPASAFTDPETGEKQTIYNLDDLAEPTPIAEINMMLQGATFMEILEAREEKF
jgi:hypothetical protein